MLRIQELYGKHILRFPLFQVERVLRRSPLRHVILRPGLIYNSEDPLTLGAAFGITALDHVMKTVKPVLPSSVENVVSENLS